MRGWPVALAVVLVGCSTNPEKRVPRAAANAMTGSPWTLAAVASLSLEGTGIFQKIPSEGNDAPLQFSVTSFKRVLNFRKRQWRGDMTFALAPAHSSSQRRVMGIIGDRAFQLDFEQGEAPPAPESAIRSEVLRHPIGFMEAAFSGAFPLSGTRTENGIDAVDLTVDGTRYTLMLDSTTKLPAKIVAMTHLQVGNLAIETSFPSYKTFHGYKLPSRIVTEIDGGVVEDLKVDQQVASADTVELALPSR